MSDMMMDGGGCKAEREPQVREWLTRMEKELCRAAELFDTVHSRLLSVLREEPPSGGETCDTQPEEQLTPLASQIRESVRKLDNISGGYERMLSRLEL